MKEHAAVLGKDTLHLWASTVVCTFGQIWWRWSRERDPAAVSRFAQAVESQRAIAKLTTEEWSIFFKASMKPGLAYNDSCM